MRAADIFRRLLIALALLALLVVVVLVYSARRLSREQAPPHFASAEEHFLYGSIGNEGDGIPYLVWLVLPRVFPSTCPVRAAMRRLASTLATAATCRLA